MTKQVDGEKRFQKQKWLALKGYVSKKNNEKTWDSKDFEDIEVATHTYPTWLFHEHIH